MEILAGTTVYKCLCEKGLVEPAVLCSTLRFSYKAIRTVKDIGVAGEEKSIGVIRLAMGSRALISGQPMNLQVSGPSSVGQGHLIANALALETPDSSCEFTATSFRKLGCVDISSQPYESADEAQESQET